MNRACLGIIAACVLAACGSSSSSSETTKPGSASGTNASADANATSPVPSGGKCVDEGRFQAKAQPPRESDPTCIAAISMTASELDADLEFKCPSTAKGSCTGAEMAQFEGSLGKMDSAKAADGLSATCRACIVSNEADDIGNPIVVREDGTSIYNQGACYAYFRGAACARAILYSQHCHANACARCTGDLAATCPSDGVCAEFAAAVEENCGDPSDLEKQCGRSGASTFVGVLCGP